MDEKQAIEIEYRLRNLEKFLCSKFEEQGKKNIQEIRDLLMPPLIKLKSGCLTTETLMKTYSES